MKKFTRLIPFLKNIKLYIESQDGYNLSLLLTIKQTHGIGLINQLSNEEALEKNCRNNIPEKWANMVYHHLRALYLYQNGDLIEACTEQNSFAKAFQRIFSESDRWTLPLLYKVHNDLHDIAIMADNQLALQNKKIGRLEDAARTINKAFTYCIMDRRMPMDNSRKWGTYFIANLLFKTYFKLKSTNLCKNIQKAIFVGDMPDLKEYPISHQITFHYYSGLILFLDEQYNEAEKHLLLAFRYSKEKSSKNTLIILHLLIPIRLLSGIIPSKYILNYHKSISDIYSGLINSIRSGNMKNFEYHLKKQEKELVRRGTYLTVEKCKILCMRRLFKKVYICENCPKRMDVSTFKRALNFVNINIDTDEVECLLAIMIEKGFIRGYISHERSVVVLSANNAFPNLKTLSLT